MQEKERCQAATGTFAPCNSGAPRWKLGLPRLEDSVTMTAASHFSPPLLLPLFPGWEVLVSSLARSSVLPFTENGGCIYWECAYK